MFAPTNYHKLTQIKSKHAAADAESAACLTGQTDCNDSLKLYCEGGEWVVLLDCWDVGRVCVSGACVVPAVDGDAESEAESEAGPLQPVQVREREASLGLIGRQQCRCRGGYRIEAQGVGLSAGRYAAAVARRGDEQRIHHIAVRI